MRDQNCLVNHGNNPCNCFRGDNDPGYGITIHSCEKQIESLTQKLASQETEIKDLKRERDLAVTHDRQPYPTAEAYERTCALLHAAKKELQEKSQLIERQEEMMEFLKEGYELILKSPCCPKAPSHGNECPKWIAEEALEKLQSLRKEQ